MKPNDRSAWESYRDAELDRIKPLIEEAGFVIDKTQVHIAGERYLTKARDVGGGGLKLVLTGRRSADNVRVIIKASTDPHGIAEIERERLCRSKIHSLNFALRAFKTPEEVYYLRRPNMVISITAYIEQKRSFFEHELAEQFFLALRALETQEGAHATTRTHAKTIEETFGITDAQEYLSRFANFKETAREALPERTALHGLFDRARAFLSEHKTLLARYSGFLTHADFVPNNLRVADRDIYLLDFSSIHFGNKYESWARFLNFMIHHQPELDQKLSEYVRTNRGEDEYLSLRLMRIYKIGFLLAYYAQALEKTEGDLRNLTELRLDLWVEAMEAMLEDRPINEKVVAHYVENLHRLRSKEEKARQRELLGQKIDM